MHGWFRTDQLHFSAVKQSDAEQDGIQDGKEGDAS